MDVAAFGWATQDRLAVLVLGTVILCYPISYFVPWTFRSLLEGQGVHGRNLEIAVVILQRLFGAVLLSVPPIWTATNWLPASTNRYGVNFDGLWVSLILSGISWVVVWFGFRFVVKVWPWVLKGYPEIHVECWDVRLLTLNTVSWVIYLAAYEFLFRGFLLYPLRDLYGAWPAVMITTALYSFTHLVKQPQEQFSTIWIGILYGVLALWTGSILAPYLIHAFTAPVSEYFAIRTHPEMFIVRKCSK